ncbi:MAG: MerR family transcriptional regulator [Candidatus Omnitrophica bacterium]|nr:MerR family transcriptional regulator [Candidatus Omnitrophota bacterium]
MKQAKWEVDKRFHLRVAPDEPVYTISVVCRFVELPVWTLRQLDRLGVLSPTRTAGQSRLYCSRDVERLRYIRFLMQSEKVNASGVKIILKTKGYLR